MHSAASGWTSICDVVDVVRGRRWRDARRESDVALEAKDRMEELVLRDGPVFAPSTDIGVIPALDIER
jgi:hypothetical protein